MKPFSVWLIPEQNVFDHLSEVIVALAQRLGGPVFDPHMTAFSGRFDGDAELIRAFCELRFFLKPFEAVYRGVGHDRDYFRSLFLELNEDRAVLRARQVFFDSVAARPSPIRSPHISLVYGELDTAEKRVLARETSMSFSTITFDRVRLVRPADADFGWYNMEKLEILDEMAL